MRFETTKAAARARFTCRDEAPNEALNSGPYPNRVPAADHARAGEECRPAQGALQVRERREMLKDIDHVQLAMPIGEEARARDFYARVLGLREIAKPPHLAARGGLWFTLGARQLHL